MSTIAHFTSYRIGTTFAVNDRRKKLIDTVNQQRPEKYGHGAVSFPARGLRHGRAVSLGFALTFNNWYKMQDDSKTFLNWYHNYSNPKSFVKF